MQNFDFLVKIIFAVFFVVIVGLTVTVSSCNKPASGGAERTVKKKSNYAFDSCVEAMRRDGNGLMATSDTCGKFLDK